MTPAQRLIEYWKGQPIAVRSGVDEPRLREFEERYRVTLPRDIREYYQSVDGFDQHFDLESKRYYCDQNGFNFYPLSKVVPVSEFEIGTEAFPHSDEYYVFADYLDLSHAYAFRLNTESSSSVVMIGTETGIPRPIADTFTEFVNLYVTDNGAIYGG